MPEPGATCAYCGELATTEDHVVPRCIRLPGDPAVTVPACQDCNRRKGLADEYLRDVLSVLVEIHQVPESQPMRDSAMSSAMREGRMPPIRQMLMTARQEATANARGELVRVDSVVTTRSERVRESFLWIVRGLHWSLTGVRLPEDVPYDLYGHQGPRNVEMFHNTWESSPGSEVGPYNIGPRFVYRAMIHTPVLFSHWKIVLWGKMYYIVSVNEQAFLALATEAEGAGPPTVLESAGDL